MQKMILVVGGAGYIGSYVNKMLNNAGYSTIVLDNLSRGDENAVVAGTFIKGEFSDPVLLDNIFSNNRIDGVMHFAAVTDVGESMTNPLKYYSNNVANTIALLSSMQKHHVDHFIFSSSAAIFGLPLTQKIDESHPYRPINPYGQSKLMVETILKDSHFKFCCLRYFNAAGGDPQGMLKNCNKNRKETNLIPVVLKSLLNQSQITIFGTDYPTPDGTCVRDYIHIDDLGAAHMSAIEILWSGGSSSCYNLGNGNGYSVREVIAAVEKVTGKKVNVFEGERRPGDPPILVADSTKAEEELGWKRRYPDIEEMIAHAWINDGSL